MRYKKCIHSLSIRKHISHPSASAYHLCGVDDLCLCPGADAPALFSVHGKQLPDWHFDLTLACHARHIPVFIHRSLHLSHAKIFLAKLFLHICAYVRHHLLFVLLDAPPEADRIGILKQHTFVIGIKGQID